MLDAKKIVSLFNQNEIRKTFPQANLNHTYYYGSSIPVELTKPRLDGKPRTKSGYPWIQTIVDTHCGFALSKQVQYYNENPESKEFLKSVFEYNNVKAIDYEHFKNCILFGRSYEAVSFNGSEYKITFANPWHWVIIRDEFDNIVYAIYKQEMMKDTVYNGKLLEKSLMVHILYTPQEIVTVEGGQIISSAPHSYGKVPVVEYRISRDGLPFISDHLIKLSDNYNISRSTLGDDVKWNTDSLLAVENAQDLEIFTQQIENEDSGTTVFDLLKSIGIFPLPPGAKAEYLSRETDHEKFSLDMNSYIEEIYNASYLPHIMKLVSGEVSSSALKLLFWPLQMITWSHFMYFENGLRRRIDLINSISALVGNPTFDSYSVTPRFSIPSSNTEIYQYIGPENLPRRELYRSLENFFDDPDAAYAQFKQEQKEK
jgi:SPP1 family phage portal protein